MFATTLIGQLVVEKLEKRDWTVKSADFDKNQEIIEIYAIQNKTNFEAIFSRDNILTLISDEKIIFHSQSEAGPRFILCPVSNKVFIKIDENNEEADTIGTLPSLKSSPQDVLSLREKSEKEIQKIIETELEQ